MNRRFSRVESAGDLLGFLDRGHLANRENRWTFEVAWEAANKVSALHLMPRTPGADNHVHMLCALASRSVVSTL